MKNYNSLDLNIIKKQICKYASIEEAKKYILNEEVSFNPLLIKNNIAKTKEALKILNDGYVINFSGINNINDYLDKADKGITLEGLELLKVLVFHNHCARLKKQFTNFDKSLLIRDYTDSINIDNNVFNKIEDCIDNNGDVKLDCTDELRKICKELEIAEKNLYSRAHQFLDSHASSLQEQAIFFRNDRLVFLFKNSDKNKYGGYAYGTSASGQATYVEPNPLIDLNNHKLELLGKKADEIERILKHLTYILSPLTDDYRKNFESLVELNVIFSKACYGFDRHGVLGELSENRYFDLKDICHPLIDVNKVISNSYRLYSPFKGIVISGSNTGGKTVSLKLIGLAVVMSYLGIPLIASSASIPLYDSVLVDIDDNQSIEDSLSTFSSHISNINNILNNASDKSLILIDELVSGTDPKQAQAISLAIIDKIKEIGSTFIITTHYDDIKNYSFKDEEILLSSVGFNMEKLTPTYKYLEDSVGTSNALEIASRYFNDQTIIFKAKEYLKYSESKQDELINKLANEIDEVELKKEAVSKLEIENNELNKTLNDKLRTFENEKDILRNKYLEELNDYINEIKEKAKEKLESIKENDNTIIKQIEDLKDEEIQIEEEKDGDIQIGDNVRIKNNEQVGTVTDIRNDVVTIDLRGMKVKTKINDLTKMPKIEKHEVKVSRPKYSRIPSELNLVGARVEDGLIEMEEYLDKANAANMSSVKIIHGIGTGALRSALREKMKKLKYINKISDGDFYDGGSAVTIVEFKR